MIRRLVTSLLAVLLLALGLALGANAQRASSMATTSTAHLYDSALDTSAVTASRVDAAAPLEGLAARNAVAVTADASSPSRVFVAAETIGDLAPSLDKGFQFGGAGRDEAEQG